MKRALSLALVVFSAAGAAIVAAQSNGTKPAGSTTLDSGRGKAIGRLDLILQPVLVNPFVDGAQQAVHLEIGEIAQVAQRA